MKKALRLALVACVSVIGLAVAGSALAAYTPKLVVNQSVLRVSQGGGTTIHVLQSKNDSATAKATIYAPVGYRATLSQTPGTQIGTVTAKANATAISADAVLPLDGVVKVADPSTIADAATLCTGTATHTATWLLVLTAAGRTLSVPVYVDTTTGDEAQIGSTKLQICLPPPDVPEASGGAAFGAKLIDALFTVNGIFTLPASNGQYVWSGLFTPYLPAVGKPNPAATVESRSFVRLPVILSLNAKVLSRKNRTVSLRGALNEAMSGIAATKVTLSVNGKASFTAKTNASGVFRGVLRVKKGTYTFRVKAVVPDRNITSTGCAGATLAPAGCVSATAGGFTVLSAIVRVKV
ncbi:MAG: hypothetical protein ACR2MU_04420 [Gaiellaceae bacterium]